MKQKFLLVFFLFNSVAVMSQNVFEVIKVKQEDVSSAQGRENGVFGFRIVLANDISARSISYPFLFPKNIDTLKAIDELLKLKGDTRLCVFPIANYNPLRSQIYLGENKTYSIQVEALFIVNQLVYDEPFNYASYPVLVDLKTDNDCSLSGNTIKEAFKAYKKWYRKLQRHGIEYATKESIMPLDNATVRWY